MTCDDLSHRLPDVATSRTQLTADERRHVDECPECSRELKLLAFTARLGDDLDTVRRPESTAGTLVTQLATAAPRRRRILAVAGFAAAAALLVAIRITVPQGDTVRAPTAPPPVAAAPVRADDRLPPDSIGAQRETGPAPERRFDPAPARIALPELEGMADEELEIVLDQLDRLFDDPLGAEVTYPAADAELGNMLTAGEA